MDNDHGPEIVRKRLQEGYGEEIVLYEKLLSLSERQYALLGCEDNEEAADVVEEKGAVIEAIRKLEERLNPVRTAWKSVESQVKPDERQSLEVVVEKVRQLIGKVLEQDEESVELLRRNTEAMVEKMQQIRRNKAAAQAYQDQNDPGSKAGGDSLLLDTKE